eukprot:RCo015610
MTAPPVLQQLLLLLLGLVPRSWAVGSQSSPPPVRCSQSAFAVPLMTALTPMFAAGHPNTSAVAYTTITGFAGITNLLQGTADFAITFVAPTSEHYNSGKKIQLLPLFVVPVVVGYNLPNAVGSLALSVELLASILAGNVTMWSDPALTALNPGLSLPDVPIRVLVRAGDSGATSILTTALNKLSPRWAARFGVFSTPQGFSGSTANLTQCKDDPTMASTIVGTQYSMG